ncbi:unnamed protein product [Sphenostylis stenocarpa]|uniref:Uncharacterized protein n=1 Tax=Sphenostylis stenocarpa TaxID=92480 RepID=A0AA86SPU3_9FABA|nr:unnamed protein product [Sphenostylis stenocarpa]
MVDGCRGRNGMGESQSLRIKPILQKNIYYFHHRRHRFSGTQFDGPFQSHVRILVKECERVGEEINKYHK